LLFGSTLALQFDISVYGLALAMSFVSLAAMVVATGQRQGGLPRTSAATLLVLGLGLFSLCAGNVLTLLVGWAMYDLLLAVGQMAEGRPPREAMRGLFLGGVATLLLWAGVLVAADGAIVRLWPLMPLTAARTAMWALAGLIRVWTYPVHLSAPDKLRTSPRSAPMLLGPLLGWGLWIRLAAAHGGSLPPYTWIPTLALVTMAVGAFLAWSLEDPRRTLPWAAMAGSGGVLVAGRAAGTSAGPIIGAGAVAWSLSVCALLMSADLMRSGLRRRRFWWSIPAWIGAASMVGLPPTLGFVTSAPLIGGLIRGGSVGGGVAFVVSQAFLIPSLVRWLMQPPDRSLPSRRAFLIAWLVGSLAPTVTLAVLGVGLSAFAVVRVPPLVALMQLLTLPGWTIWVVSLVIGGLLVWQERNLRPRVAYLLGVFHDLWRLDWLYGALAGAFDRGLSLVRAADDVIGGTGALLWSVVLFLIIVMVWAA
jgi:NADH:ubiquinone oxidoreductase subunit 2 (subunit N)